MDDVYAQLGVRRVINAAGTLTRLSGSLMEPSVFEAMAQASRSFVRIDQLQAAVGARIAGLCGAEAALVTSGAAAGLTLAAAAAIARFDLARMDQLPQSEGPPPEIIVPRSHRNGYDHALRAAGARLVEVGLAERTRDPQPWELAAAVTPHTVALAFSDGFSPLPLAEVVAVAHEHSLPVIVDAAASLPPVRNLTAFTAAGADLVTYSGGKAIRGPQSSGILCGSRDLIASAALQMWDMDVVGELWDPPGDLIPADVVARGVPNHGIGRAMKVGKEEIVGLWAALERFAAHDEAAAATAHSATSATIAEGLAGLPGVAISLVDSPRGGPGGWHHVRLVIDAAASKLSAVELVRALEHNDPPIYVAQGHAPEGIVAIDPFCLAVTDVPPLIAAITRLLGG